MAFYTYILASRRNGTLYIGHTDSLIDRVEQHREGEKAHFTRRYGVHTLVWYEIHDSREDAFKHERRLKKWNRIWKIEMIERFNPGWADLYPELL
jgi:putative endonuclease